jgi:hypothetical protein
VLGAEIIGWNIVAKLLRRYPPYLRWSLCPRAAEGIGNFENCPFIGEEGDDSHVYRMVTEESIEQKIMDLKARKSKIVDALVNENALSPRSLTRADLEQLLSPLPVDGF